jgi:membrane protein YqaA with SNARE-associated domain
MLAAETVRNKATHWLISLGGPGLFVVGIIDSSAIPTFGSLDAFIIFLAAAHRAWWWYYALMAAAGSIVGAYITYVIAKKGGKEPLEKKFGKKRLQKVYDYYERRGFWAVFIPSVLPPPFPTSPFLLSAGALNYPLRNYMIAVSIARSLRYAALAIIGALYGGRLVSFFQKHHRAFFIAMTALAIVGGAAIGWYMWRQHKQRKGGRSGAQPQPKAA